MKAPITLRTKGRFKLFGFAASIFLSAIAPVLEGNASLIDIASGQKVVSPQSDPDSLKVDPVGDLVLDSQANGDLIFINAPWITKPGAASST